MVQCLQWSQLLLPAVDWLSRVSPSCLMYFLRLSIDMTDAGQRWIIHQSDVSIYPDTSTAPLSSWPVLKQLHFIWTLNFDTLAFKVHIIHNSF